MRESREMRESRWKKMKGKDGGNVTFPLTAPNSSFY